MLVERNLHGAIIVSEIVDNRRVHKVYYGYSESYAIRNFKKLIKNELGKVKGVSPR